MNNTIQPESNESTAFAIAESSAIVETCQAVNNTLETTKVVTPFFGTHYANAEMGVCGIVELVKQVLRENDAVLPRGIETSEFRKIAIAASMFTSEIVDAVGIKFANAGMRYKAQAVKNVLSTYGTDSIAKITLSSNEDTPRPCSKPRAKWYLIEKKG